MSLLTFDRPAGLPLYRLGKPRNHEKLKSSIAPFLCSNFAVNSPGVEIFLADVRRMFDESFGTFGQGIVYKFVFAGDDAQLVEQLLSLGIHPDLTDSRGWRPLHYCAAYGRPGIAETILTCRPDLAARNGVGDTPIEAASTVSADKQYNVSSIF